MGIEQAIVVSHTRQNTGKDLCDSGGEDGRHWQQPVPTSLIRFRQGEGWWDTAITLTGLLREHATLVCDVQAAIETEYKADRKVGNFEVGPRVMERLGYCRLHRQNTCNWDTDLDQAFVFEVWSKDGDQGWLWAKGSVVLVYAHTGADVRSGYARPIAVTFDGDPTVPTELKVSFSWVDEETQAWCLKHEGDEHVFDRSEVDNPESELEEKLGAPLEWQEDKEVLVFRNPHYDDNEPGQDEPEKLTFYPHFCL